MGKGTCSISGCERPVQARGWCQRHYVRWWKHGDPETLLIPGYDVDVERTPPNLSGLCECGCGGTTPVAAKSDKKHGWVQGEHKRFIHGHYKSKPTGPKGPRWEIDPETGCWNWLLWLHHEGYGYGRQTSGKNMRAHRLIWEEQRGPIPANLHLHHVCENRRCVNPDHMELLEPFEHHRLHEEKRTV